MTDITVFTQALPSEDLSWDLTRDTDAAFDGSGTIDVSAFDQTQHYPNGFIKSGCVLGVITASGLLGPYLDSASDGTETAVGILKGSVQVVQPNGQIKTKVGCGFHKAFAAVSDAKLPYTSSNAALGGFIDANGKADLPLIHFDA